MANTIIVKHRTGKTGAPTLVEGEIAANIYDKQIFIGTGDANNNNVVFPDKTYVDTAVSSLINSAPAALDTLKELADALGDDANFSTTVTNNLATKAPLDSPALTGTPTSPTPVSGDNTTNIATTAFVQSAISGVSQYSGWIVSDGTNSENINSGDTVEFTGAGATTTSYNTNTNILTISSTDTTYTSSDFTLSGLSEKNFASLTNKPTTISGYGITDAQAKSASLTGIAGITGTDGLLKRVNGNWSLDTTAYTTNKGTVTSVGLSVPTGLVVGSSPVTTSGTISITFDSGYAIPTTAKQSNWDTAYGWGNHANAGYLNASSIIDGGTF